MNDWKFYFSFEGRLNRAKYWLYALLFFPVTFGLFFFAAVLQVILGNLITFLVFVFFILLFVSTIAVTVKRLHDRNYSGWTIVLFWFVPGLLEQLADAAGSTQPMAIVVYVMAFGIAAWGFVEIGCLRGTVGPNRFGSDPLATESTTALT